jgi:IMP dehydrogenase/GMP reductase
MAVHYSSIMVNTTATITGTATGQRYYVSGNSTIHVVNNDANFFPGNVNGSTATGGIYY